MAMAMTMTMENSVIQYILQGFEDQETKEAVEKALREIFRWTPNALKTKAGRNNSTAMVRMLKRGLYPESATISADDEGRLLLLSDQIICDYERFQVLDKFEKGHVYTTARLTSNLLHKNGLSGYVQAAEKSFGDAEPFLDKLLELQSHDKELPKVFSNVDTDDKASEANQYVCITTSSGTGKTQLAATASIHYKKATTIYLNFVSVQDENPQDFYKPHTKNLSGALILNITEQFLEDVKVNDMVTAKIIGNWADNVDEGMSVFVRFLYRLLIGTDTDFPPSLTLNRLNELIRDRGGKFLVFLDEVPVKGSKDFRTVLCLRDALRYLGICPILMSTHTGAQDHVSESSRGTIDLWAHVLARLPAHAPKPAHSPTTAYVTETERPLVLIKALELIKKGSNLRNIVEQVRRKLQKTKWKAWTKNPCLQLVQLFCNDFEIGKNTFAFAHNLVGHHFGCLQHQIDFDEDCPGVVEYTCGDAAAFGESMSVASVSPKYEPLLYLALVAWDETMIPGTRERYFPLVGSGFEPLTVREVFVRKKDQFIPAVNPANIRASKLEGDLLEVLVHASFTLASMKTGNADEPYLPGVELKFFIALVRRFMLSGKLLSLPATPIIFESIEGFDWPRMPALGGSNSGLPYDKLGKDAMIGFLERPPDRDGVDGLIKNNKEDKSPLFSVECKNYKGGVPLEEIKKVFKRIPGSVRCAFVFVTSLGEGMFKKSQLAETKRLFIHHHNKKDRISVVRWKQDQEPSFLRVGGTDFKASQTDLLVVIIEVGEIGGGNLNPSQKRNSPPCSNFPLKRHRAGNL